MNSKKAGPEYMMAKKILKNTADITRFNFLPACIVPFFISAAMSLRGGYRVDITIFFLAFSAIAFFHLAGNVFNNYFDNIYGADSCQTVTTPFFGGTKAIVCGDMTADRALKIGVMISVAAFFLTLLMSFILKDINIILMASVAGILALQYTAGPLRLSYRGFGEAVIFLLFGPGIVAGGFYVFTGYFSLESVIVSIIPGALIFSVIMCNEIPDIVTDRIARKNNLAVILGRDGAIKLYFFALLVSVIFFIVSIMTKILPQVAVILLILYIPAFFVFRYGGKRFDPTQKSVVASTVAVSTHFAITFSVACFIMFG